MDSERTFSWTRGPIIGAGAFGTVNMGLNCETGSLFAVKSVEADIFPERLMALDKEIEILSSVTSDRVVKYLGTDWTVEDGVRRRNMMMEFVPGGSIADLAKNFGGKLKEPLIRKYTKDILEGLRDLHFAGIVHSDIKGKNILVGTNGAKLCDLGAAEFLDAIEEAERQGFPSEGPPSTSSMAASMFLPEALKPRPLSPKVQSPTSGRCSPRRSSTGTSKLRGTVCWMAPEVLQTPTCAGTASDIWSLGCTVIEMATGDSPWGVQVADACSALYRIGLSQSVPEFPSHLSPQAHDFLSKCLQRDPSLRPSAEDLLNHPFVTEEYNPIHGEGKNDADGFAGTSISPTSVLQISSDWDFPEPALPKLPRQHMRRSHRRSVSDLSLFSQRPTPSLEASAFPALAKLAAASSGGEDGLIIPVKNPSKVKKLQRTQTADEIDLRSYWASPSSPQAVQGQWIAVHSTCTTPGARSVADLSPTEKKTNLSWQEDCDTCGGDCVGNHEGLDADDDEANAQAYLLCPSLTFGQQ